MSLKCGDLGFAYRFALPVGNQIIKEQALVGRLDAITEGLELGEQMLKHEGEVTTLEGQWRRDEL